MSVRHPELRSIPLLAFAATLLVGCGAESSSDVRISIKDLRPGMSEKEVTKAVGALECQPTLPLANEMTKQAALATGSQRLSLQTTSVIYAA